MVKVDLKALMAALDEIEPGKLYFVDRQTGKIITVVIEDKIGLENMKKLLAKDATRYSQVPRQEARQNFVELEKFVAQVSDPKLVELLKRALISHRPFREFRDVLERRVKEKREWEAFHRKNLEDRARVFLKSAGLS